MAAAMVNKVHRLLSSLDGLLPKHSSYELLSKLLEGGYIGDYIGDYYKGYCGGY